MSSSKNWTELSGDALLALAETDNAGDGVSGSDAGPDQLLGLDGGPAAARLFDAVVHNRGARFAFDVIGAPGGTVSGALRSGDLLVRRALGEGALARAAVVADAALYDVREIETRGVASERLRPGAYAEVVEPAVLGRSGAGRLHRLVLDADGRVPADQLILRSRVGAEASGTPSGEGAAAAGEIDRRSRDYVRWQQDALNQIVDARLTVDGLTGPRTTEAVRHYQTRRPPLRVDGVVGANTERQLIADGASYPPGYSAAMDDAPGAPPAFPPATVSRPNVHKPARYALRRMSRGVQGKRAAATRLIAALDQGGSGGRGLGGIYSDASSEAGGLATNLGVAPAGMVPANRVAARVGGGRSSAFLAYRDQAKNALGLLEDALAELAETPPEPAASDRYGGFDLRYRDHDHEGECPAVWGGRVQTAAAGEGAPPRHVRQLQEDLRTLGFALVPTPNGRFERRTEWGVREFQIYAKMNHVARENASSTATRIVDRLSQVATGSHRYTGPISGVVNQETRRAIAHWLANHWRCPVVVEAWTMSGGTRSALHAQNLWMHNSMGSSAPRVFVRDFSGYYTFPTGQNPNDPIVIGDFAEHTATDNNGPRSIPPNHTWAQGEILPDAFVGVALGSLNASQRSTFKVIRAVSEVECYGFFDSVNAYDNAFISLGPCHWTLGIDNRNCSVSEGELCGYLAFLRHADNAAYRAAIEFFGATVDENWVRAGVPDGGALFVSSQRKYVGWMALQDETGCFQRLPLECADGFYFKTWHWHYRFVMAGRTIAGYRRRMWDMARVRVRDIRNSPWGAGVAQVNAGTPTARDATIGDLFTSERAMGLILRWHIRFPGDIIAGGHAAARLRAALTHAQTAAPGLTWTGAPNTWTNAHETALLNGLRNAVAARGNTGLTNSINYVDHWPNWATGPNPRGYALPGSIGALSQNRNSFNFENSGLPPAP